MTSDWHVFSFLVSSRQPWAPGPRFAIQFVVTEYGYGKKFVDKTIGLVK